LRATLGCGFDERCRDKATCTYERGGGLRTCPEFFARQPWVLSVYEWLPGYRQSGLAELMDLPAALVDSLRVLDAEVKAFEAYISGKLVED